MEKKDLSLYIHIPFCERKCAYCDFLSTPSTAEERSYYNRVLQKEIRSFEAVSTLFRVKTIFFGGGTPSILESRQFSSLMQQLREHYDIDPDAEISIECNPGTLTEEKLKTYREEGVNRISLGLQSANDAELKELGRIHTYEQFTSNYALARRLGFDNINVDLMSGIPNQTMLSWKDTLSKVVELGPEHISAYSLILEPGTPFYEKYSDPMNARLLPDEKLDRDMYHFTKEFLGSNGYNRYEISNYAKDGKECKHNLVYWRLGSYIGFGLGASSYFGGKRFSNPKDKDEYWKHARNAYYEYQYLPEQPIKEAKEEFMFLGLRTMKGVSINEFNERFNEDFDILYGMVTSSLIDTGFMKRDGDYISLTDKGIDVSNKVLANYLLGEV